MSENEQGFTVKDKRFFNQDGSQKEEADKVAAAAAEEVKEALEKPASAKEPAFAQAQGQVAEQKEAECKDELDSGDYRNLPPVDFGSFVISLTHAAMLHMGHLNDPSAPPVEQNLTLARHTIDTIAMLKEKTTGNLDQQEQALLDGILTELRMLYVQTCKNQ